MYYRALQQQELRIPVEHINFIKAFQYRMYQLAYLTRFYIVQSITGLGDPNVVLNELKEMPALFKELGESIPGVTVPDEIVNIFSEYNIRLFDLVNSMLSGDQAKADESIRRLYQLSDEFAAALSQFNPYWDKEVLKEFYLTYFQEIVNEIIAIKNGDFDIALDIFNRLMLRALDLGDIYAEGFLKLAPPPVSGETISVGQFNMVKDMRFIMAEVAYLTRFYMVARIINLYESGYIAQKLHTLPAILNQKTETILGAKNSEGLYNLLSEYFIKLESLINSILANDTAMIEASMNDFYQHSNQTAEYLASINPYWSESKWKELLYSFNTYIIDEAIAFQRKEYDYESLFIFEEMLKAALDIADYFAQGLDQYFKASEF